MIIIDYKSRKPIYEQIIDSVKTLVLTGVYKRDDQLPPVRQLAVDLAINPNTIQKAYAELERQGIIYSMKGKGSFIGSNLDELRGSQKEQLLLQLEEVSGDLYQLQVPEAELQQKIHNVYTQNGGK